MSFKLSKILSEQDLSGRKARPLIDAIKNRNPVTFYYSGPTKPPKDSVKKGTRLRAEVVAMGLSKKGNLIVRAYVQPPSVSKKGYSKTNWRTFIVNRMSNITVLTDEVFDVKRPGYKEGSESDRGPMVKTYVTTDWTKTPEVPQKDVPSPTTPTPKPKEKLPQPKPEVEPKVTPQPSKDHIGDIFKTLKPNEIDGKKIISTQDYQKAVSDLYKRKESDWKNTQRDLGKNTIPGEGTRKRFEIESNKELSDILRKNNINVSDKTPTIGKKEELPQPKPNEKPPKNIDTSNEDDVEPLIGLSEEIIRIKTLMFS